MKVTVTQKNKKTKKKKKMPRSGGRPTRNMPMVPISTAKGSTSSEKDGRRRSVIQASKRPGTSPEKLPARRNISMKSTKKISTTDEGTSPAWPRRTAAKNSAPAFPLH